MSNNYIIYKKQGKVQKYRTFKSYATFKLRIYTQALIKRSISAFQSQVAQNSTQNDTGA